MKRDADDPERMMLGMSPIEVRLRPPFPDRDLGEIELGESRSCPPRGLAPGTGAGTSWTPEPPGS
eukprot:2345142-Pyramimonas_sp.AAC.1